jgi:uncharacterized Zn finger protein (UPF0148 family)
MDKPCDNCSTAMAQAANYDGEVTCYMTCESFKKWREEVEQKAELIVD